jgi:hypothetical protein
MTVETKLSNNAPGPNHDLEREVQVTGACWSIAVGGVFDPRIYLDDVVMPVLKK